MMASTAARSSIRSAKQCSVLLPARYARHRTFAAAATNDRDRRVVLVDGCRIPFSLSQTKYNDLRSYDLGRLATHGLLTRTALDPQIVDYFLWGTVIQEVRTSNLAREVALGSGIPKSVPAHTVTQACISSNQAITSAAEKIISGQADVVIAGGSETFSDVPIRFSRPLRERLLKAQKAAKKGMPAVLKLLRGLKLKDLAPEAPAIANFHTGEVMGHSSDRLASRFGVSREQQDVFALESHKRAARAHANGFYDDEILPVGGTREENGIKSDSTLEKLASLKPAFIKPHGTHTAANSSFLTDGAAVCLLMSEAKAADLGYKPKSVLKHWTYAAVDPFEDLLLGPTYAIHKILNQSGMSLEDFDVVEIHEAFAGQVLANLTAMSSSTFCKENLGRDTPMGQVDGKKLNRWGGSLSLGHPFGATGARLTTTASNILHRDGGKYALLAACADSGLAVACILEKYEN